MAPRLGRLWRYIRVILMVFVTWQLFQMAVGRNSLLGPATSSRSSDVCRRHGWRRFNPTVPDRPRKVYDLFMINTELDWLEIRLNTTWPEVDYFVIVESNRTFTNLKKPLVLKNNLHKFLKYQDKIIYHQIQYPASFVPRTAWDMEDLQRNSMLTQVFPKLKGAQKPSEGDVIVVSDVDEIPRPETLAALRQCQYPRRLTLRSRFYYYSFQFLHRGEEWAHPQATYYQGLAKTILPNDLRIGDGPWPWKLFEKGNFKNASWHCSSCFETMDEFLTKMKSFAHTSMNAERFREKKRIADRVRNGKDVWDRPTEQFDRIENNQDVPAFLLHNKERFSYLLDRDGPTAGFSDYHDIGGSFE
ncbi:glycosyltransferase [Podospora australis]|uniref:Glycosyltransferase n=1 Tax=Podospora australis TaxID=1536484 RepID=A0AAN6X2I0_9PEZI|nr:glycosyltransferase [Podospora australis]